MTIEAWQEQNGRYLSASLKWLRLKLQQVAAVSRLEPGSPASHTMPASDRPVSAHEGATAGPGSFTTRNGQTPAAPIGVASIATDATPPAHDRRPLFQRWLGGPAGPSGVTAAPLTTSSDVAELIQQAEAERAEAEQMEPPPALVMLGHDLGLTEFERDTLLLCVAMELDTRVPGLCAQAQGDPGRPYPTFALALTLFDDPSWDVVTPHRGLRYWRLVEISQPGGTPLTHSVLRADERITNCVKGLNALDDRLANWLHPLPGEATLSASQIETMATMMWHWQHAPTFMPLPVAQLLGADDQCKRLVARQAAATLQRQLYTLNADELPTSVADIDQFVRLWQRESLLLSLALYLDAQSHDSPETWRALDRFLSRAVESNGLLLVGVRDALPELAATSFTVDVARPALAEQRDAWLQLLADEHLANQLASQFNFNLPDLVAIADQAQASAAVDVWAHCRAKTRPRLDTLAQRLVPKATWDDLVLPPEPERLLHAVADQVRNRAAVYEDWGFGQRMNRGMGISALFAGESGTGKTMAAEVIANDLRLDLYRIDLSAVVSKYIGETEKNLRRLFDAAEDGGAILFFDEADALFGKRSEVKDSHDRYANIEINYLLQRMEAYSGLAILATNLKTALDQAFMRRLRFVVNFAFPGVAERKAIWQKVFPPEAPQDGLDYDRLARLSLTGGNIHSIALNAAFLAAQANTTVTMPLVLAAARTEFRKLEKPINEAEFRV